MSPSIRRAYTRTRRRGRGCFRRFTYMEEQTIQQGKSLHDMSLQEMDKYWVEAKKMER